MEKFINFISQFIGLEKAKEKTSFELNNFIIGKSIFYVIENKTKNTFIFNTLIEKILQMNIDLKIFSSYFEMYEYYEYFEDEIKLYNFIIIL